MGHPTGGKGFGIGEVFLERPSLQEAHGNTVFGGHGGERPRQRDGWPTGLCFPTHPTHPTKRLRTINPWSRMGSGGWRASFEVDTGLAPGFALGAA